MFEDKLTKAATGDSAKNFLATLWARVDSEEAYLNWLWKGLFAVSNSKRHQWREAAAKSIINGTPVTGSDSCGNGIRTPLLPLAVKAGNYESTRAMLELGATPDAPRFDQHGRLFDTLFWHVCPSAYEPTIEAPQVVEGRLRALKLVLAAGADLNRANENGKTALHVCLDPVILRFYLANGANQPQQIDMLSAKCAEVNRPASCHLLLSLFPDLFGRVSQQMPNNIESQAHGRARHFDP